MANEGLHGRSAEPGLDTHLAQEQREQRERHLRRNSEISFLGTD
jgi:hypothetical protein